MTVLSDRDIKKRLREGSISISDFGEEQVNSCSIDLRLGRQFRVFKHSELTFIDPRNGGVSEEMTTLIEVPEGKPFVIHPGEFVLANTLEKIRLPDDLCGRLDGRSSLGRLGIIVHGTASAIDPGFEGRITLEVTNISNIPVCLWPGSRVCRLTFDMLSSPSEIPYNKKKDAKYLNELVPGASKIGLE